MLEILVGIVMGILAALYAFAKYKGWTADKYKNGMENAEGALEDWRGYSRAQEENSVIDTETNNTERGIMNEPNTDELLDQDRNSGNWVKPI